MSGKLERLVSGGDVEAIKAAIVADANAVYCGLDAFNARNRASNLSILPKDRPSVLGPKPL